MSRRGTRRRPAMRGSSRMSARRWSSCWPRPRALRGAAGRGAGSQGCARQRRGEGASDRLADP
jgi:hypothetical protein